MDRSVYVETTVATDLQRLWALTQDPAQHARWDGRFTRITPDPGDPLAFTYALHLPGRERPGLRGTGTSVGERYRPDGSCTSALRFRSDARLSPIRAGAGFWRYQPVPGGVRLLTGYRYEPGPQGRRLDDALVRPALGWLTAWSFDRLRLWAEGGPTPEALGRRALAAAGLRIGLLVVAGRRGGALRAGLTALALVPSPWAVPRARRCLRRPPSREDARPPSTLASLRRPLAAR